MEASVKKWETLDIHWRRKVESHACKSPASQAQRSFHLCNCTGPLIQAIDLTPKLIKSP
jgi:hypothetical protein